MEDLRKGHFISEISTIVVLQFFPFVRCLYGTDKEVVARTRMNVSHDECDTIQ